VRERVVHLVDGCDDWVEAVEAGEVPVGGLAGYGKSREEACRREEL
jgi:hypothetical protein